MGRGKDLHYWNKVTKERNGYLKCKECGHKFKGGVTRIKAHVDRIQGQGISVCSSTDDPQPPQEEASTADGLDPLLFQESTAAVRVVIQSNNDNGFVSDEINQLNELLCDLTLAKDNIKGDLEWFKIQGKKSKTKVEDWLNEVQQLEKRVGDCLNKVKHWLQMLVYSWTEEYPADLRLEIQQLTTQVKEHVKQKPVVLSNEFVGETFERNIKKLWELLGDDKVLMIGIHGMGGTGKTCIATHMEMEIKRKGNFKHIIWVTVSRDFSISKMQQDIAETIGVKLTGGDERRRAAHLSSVLSETGMKWVLILDDVWKFIDLQKVGIPLSRINGSKLILTSRLEKVFGQIDCPADNVIRMDHLSESEGLELFLLKLGHNGTPAKIHSDEKLWIAECIASEFHGLPLGITVMARTLKGIDKIQRWKFTFHRLLKLELGTEMEEEVFKVLKVSYDNLMDKCKQNCFLHCALYSGGKREELIMLLVERGVINGRSVEEIYNEGHTMLDELEDHSLLLLDSSGQISMHHANRDMACYILKVKENYRWMVKCDEGLTEIPHLQEWNNDLELVSLDCNYIKEISVGISPYCPQLSTLILSDNEISSIPECFFKHMKSLAILDLSYNHSLKWLPSSLSDLTSLVSLVLKCCEELKNIPPLGGLKKLSRLVISMTSVEQVAGLEMLTNLRWLDLSHNDKLRLESGSVLCGLTNLQCLNLLPTQLNVRLEDIHGLTTLERFVAYFLGHESYNNYVKSIWNRGSGPRDYFLCLGEIHDFQRICDAYDAIEPIVGDYQILYFFDCVESPHLLPKDLRNILIESNTHWKSLCGALSGNAPSSLLTINIDSCTEMKSLFCLFGNCSFRTNLKNLRSLKLSYLESLRVICKEDVADTDTTTQPLSPNAVFSDLRHLKISHCDELETLLTARLLSQLENLQTLTVESCVSLREIFATGSSDSDADPDDGASTTTLCNFTTLELLDLPMLESVCKGIIICPSFQKLDIKDCPKLESRSPFQVSSSS